MSFKENLETMKQNSETARIKICMIRINRSLSSKKETKTHFHKYSDRTDERGLYIALIDVEDYGWNGKMSFKDKNRILK